MERFLLQLGVVLVSVVLWAFIKLVKLLPQKREAMIRRIQKKIGQTQTPPLPHTMVKVRFWQRKLRGTLSITYQVGSVPIMQITYDDESNDIFY